MANMFYKPKLIEISIQELINHIRIKADSSVGPSCNLSYTDEYACGVWTDGNDGAGGGDWGHMCIEIGPLFCCNQHEDWYCSTQITPIVAANKLAVYINLYEMCF